MRRDVDQCAEKCREVGAGDDDLVRVAAERAFLTEQHVTVVVDLDGDLGLRRTSAALLRAIL